MMQCFSHLRRNPHDAPDDITSGKNFCLNKLNQFNGNSCALKCSSHSLRPLNIVGGSVHKHRSNHEPRN